MAKRKSTRGTHFPRNRGPKDRQQRDPVITVAPTASTPAARPAPEAIDVAIEGARARLMRARAVLDCTRFVLLYDDQLEGGPGRPSFSDAIDVARDLVDEVVDALDRVNLRAAKK